MTSPTEIANRALQCLGDSPILDINDDSERARVLKRAYEPVRKAVLRSHPWNFTRKRTSLAPDAKSPEFEFAYQYTIPADCLRILPTADDRDWVIEGRKILTGTGPVLYLRYVADITDVNEMDDLFVEAFAKKLAVECCEKITQSTSKRQLAQAEYNEAISLAKQVGAFEQQSEDFPEDEWVRARY